MLVLRPTVLCCPLAVERWLNKIWVWIMEPMLFVTIGASINFKTLDGGTIPKALIIIFSGTQAECRGMCGGHEHAEMPARQQE